MAIGWKPNLTQSQTVVKKQSPISFNKLVRSASAELLGRFGPTPDADDEHKKWKRAFEIEVETRLNAMHVLPFSDGVVGRKSMSTDTETLRESYDAGSLEDDTRFEDVKEACSTRPLSQDVAFV